MRQIVLDTETTGLNPAEGHRVIEIGCIELINRRFTGKHFHYYLNPEREVEEGALKVHGINNAFLATKPLFKEIYPKLIEYLGSAELIIHNAPFDTSFLNTEFLLVTKQAKKIHQLCSILDTLHLARQMHPGQRNSLDALCKRYAVDNSDRNLHGALLDAQLLARVYLAMTSGQSSFFDSFESQNKSAENLAGGITAKTQNHWDMPVVKANTAELKTHKEYLEKMQQQCGKVIWEEG